MREFILMSPWGPKTVSPISLRHSRDRLKRAKEALGRLEVATQFIEIETSWSEILSLGHSIYAKLEQGVKGDKNAVQWFSGIKSLRKKDELLRYVHHARNSDEHELKDISQRRDAGQATFEIREPFNSVKLEGVSLKIDLDDRGHVKIHSSDEKLISTKMFPVATVEMLPVSGGGRVFNPPTRHLGLPLEYPTPQSVAKLYVEYLENLVKNAEN